MNFFGKSALSNTPQPIATQPTLNFGAKPSFGGANMAFGNTGFSQIGGFKTTQTGPFLLQKTPVEELLEQMKAKFPANYNSSLAPAPSTAAAAFSGFGGGNLFKPAAPAAQGTVAQKQPQFEYNFGELLKSSNNLQMASQLGSIAQWARITSTQLTSTPDFGQLQQVQQNWRLRNENGEIQFEEPVNIEALVQGSNGALNLDEIVKIMPGQVMVDKLKYPELNKQILVKLLNIEQHGELRRVVEAQGWLYGCYNEQDGQLIFRIPRD